MKKELGIGLVIIGIVVIVSVAVADIRIPADESRQSDNNQIENNQSDNNAEILDCSELSCNSTYNGSNEKIDYVIIDNYDNFLKFKKNYLKGYSKYASTVDGFNKSDFKDKNLAIFKKFNCSIDSVSYKNNLAIISYTQTKCAYLMGEIKIVKINKKVNKIQFVQNR